MAIHRVAPGEDLSGIAYLYGLDPDALWEANETLRAKRSGPGILFEGDEVEIPEEEKTFVEIEAGKTHRFRRHGTHVVLKLALEDEEGEALADVKLRVHPFTAESRPLAPIDASLDGEGKLDLPMPTPAAFGQLDLYPDTPEQVSIPFTLGEIDPPEEDLAGAQAMLNNLGYPCGEEDAEFGEQTHLALAEFEAEHDLPPRSGPDQKPSAEALQTLERCYRGEGGE